ncbi:hypothetical protein GQ43DRAFT_371055 [Delitschia confertaspora ATCC 74209]|uniref:Zn(2)-C6 fungal-type domain-containing protein n=1 Tax=Delitschia confertaspora ATCC 74209 TaxID=1513339 RepID=A0A9P4JNS5_9PLEO|nr:hypothetical protein GQ43DRAFT_371055 [Delitschia confertaspora ATCC 74209]
MPTSGLSLPSKACHNCRRRRWKCDRSLPVCQKCLHSGVECLGYGKLFLWNRGVASRGKMMGKMFEETRQKSDMESALPLPSSKDNSTVTQLEQNVISTSDVVKVHHVDPSLQWTLIDPLVRDLDPHSRYYLSHFAMKLCGDIVINDDPGQNPMRDLVPATSMYPLLRHVMVANSAFHVHNLSRQLVIQSRYQERQTTPITPYYQTGFDGPFQSSYRDALLSKQAGLSLLSQSVEVVNQWNFDIILAAVILFINYDLIESGKDSWKVHFQGARKLISLLGDARGLGIQTQHLPMSKLRTCLLADSIVFFILGSTLTFSNGSPQQLIPDTLDLDTILQYAETNNYLSCPAPLLRIMLKSFKIPDARIFETTTPFIEDQVGSLLEEVLAFDAVVWASESFQPISPHENLSKRVCIASAHRAAVCLYIARVLPTSSPLISPSSPTAIINLSYLASDIVYHLSYLNPGDTVFKSISWALFLAGAESDIPAQRTWIMEKLDALWKELYWGYVRTVKEVLELIWGYKDRAARGENVCWIEEVRRMGTELLIA